MTATLTEGTGSRTAFLWNAGGWFGSQIGSTLWLGVLGALTIGRDRLAGLVALGALGALNLLGFALWSARRRLAAYDAIQIFLGVTSVAVAAVVWIFVDRGAGPAAEPGAWVSTALSPWLVLVFPALMLFFHLRERAARRRAEP